MALSLLSALATLNAYDRWAGGPFRTTGGRARAVPCRTVPHGSDCTPFSLQGLHWKVHSQSFEARASLVHGARLAPFGAPSSLPHCSTTPALNLLMANCFLLPASTPSSPLSLPLSPHPPSRPTLEALCDAVLAGPPSRWLQAAGERAAAAAGPYPPAPSSALHPLRGQWLAVLSLARGVARLGHYDPRLMAALAEQVGAGGGISRELRRGRIFCG